jgi:hypothetical protein
MIHESGCHARPKMLASDDHARPKMHGCGGHAKPKRLGSSAMPDPRYLAHVTPRILEFDSHAGLKVLRSDGHAKPKAFGHVKPKIPRSGIPKCLGLAATLDSCVFFFFEIKEFTYNWSKNIFIFYFHLCLFNKIYYYLFYICFFYFGTLTTHISKIHLIFFN